MAVLSSELRNQLQRTVVRAREVAETGARSALQAFAVNRATPYPTMNEELCRLRNRLRAHGRQLGDKRSSGGQEIDLLLQECAYQHWHRMLFARFLAENNLLIEPESGVAVTLAECDELAKAMGQDTWALAGAFAQNMLPQVFRRDDPLLEVEMPPETKQELERLVSDLPASVFQADDALGWTYQFWQTKSKDEVNKSGVKIGARELPAVTQLFTEPYMVSFLLDNSLGAWWAAQRLSAQDLASAANEDELRAKAALPGVPLQYLRFVRRENGTWTPAAGTFAQWPKDISELKVLDPCCGSGHFLVAALKMLVPMRICLEGLSAAQAVDAVLRQNLHGLELDQRCVELAAFSLAFAAWCYPGTGGYRALPSLNVACSGLSVTDAKEAWRELVRNRHYLRIALDMMHELFADAPTLGSLINPAKTDASKLVCWEELPQILEKALSQEESDEQHAAGVVAHGLAKAVPLMAGEYHLVITNVPYLARGKQSEKLRKFCASCYPAAKNDLATAFLERCLEYCRPGGSVSVVLPQNWLFLTSYKRLRRKLLERDTWHLVAWLGSQAFQTITGEVVKAILLTISRGNAMVGAELFSAEYHGNMINGIDVTQRRSVAEKAEQLRLGELTQFGQKEQLENPDARVTLEIGGNTDLLKRLANSFQGVSPADSPQFGRCFWEQDPNGNWVYWQSAVSETMHYGGREQVLWLDKVLKKAEIEKTAYIRGVESWNKDGIAVSAMRSLPVTISKGHPFDTNVAIIVPNNADHLPAIWCFCSSPEYNQAVRRIDQKLNVTNATIVKVPFDLDYWTKVAQEKYPNGLPKPYSDDPTQWVFHGHPVSSDNPLQVAVARLLGYRWPAEMDTTMELSDEAHQWIEEAAKLNAFADDDGVVCISSIRGEPAAAERLQALLAAAYDDQWSAQQLHQLLAQAGSPGKSLDEWLRDDFFSQHCRIFHHRPFIWHIWDGRRDGFHALVNYHRLAGADGEGKRLLEAITFTYLGNWIQRQRAEQREGKEGADARLAAALDLQEQLYRILEGEPPYDIFVRWKPLHQQPIGWVPDINDGVRINIRPFMSAQLRKGGRSGAGILRWKPNISWSPDRGKEPLSLRPKKDFPWFWGCNPEKQADHRTDYLGSGEFDGTRWNELHYSRRVKEAARAEQRGMNV